MVPFEVIFIFIIKCFIPELTGIRVCNDENLGCFYGKLSWGDEKLMKRPPFIPEKVRRYDN